MCGCGFRQRVTLKKRYGLLLTQVVLDDNNIGVKKKEGKFGGGLVFNDLPKGVLWG